MAEHDELVRGEDDALIERIAAAILARYPSFDPISADGIAVVAYGAVAPVIEARALREAAHDWPLGSCAHRCFREEQHVAPRECLYGPDWISDRADRIEGA
jgi:hypothetical protein